MTWTEALTWLGALLAVAGTAMKTIIPLRIVGIAGNLVSLVVSAASLNYAGVLANLVLLPVNTVRLVQMTRLIRKVKHASCSDLSLDWLRPYMTRRAVKTGEILFAKGDEAHCMFVTLSGSYQLAESGLALGPNAVVGEMGFIAPQNRRTQTLACREAGDVLTISYDDLRQLYFQNPEFGFYFLRLTSQRLFQNVATLEAEVKRLRGDERPTLERAA